MANLIDVSSNNHPNGCPIDWCELVKNGVRGVMVKATEGVDYLNPWLARDAHGARAAGLLVGYYHFAHPGQDKNPQAEVDWLARAVQDLPHELGLALDLEVTEGLSWDELGAWGHGFLEALAEHADWTILYSNENFLNGMIGAPWGHRLWYARPGARPRRTCWAWQYGVASGVGRDVATAAGGDVDVNMLYEWPKAA